MSPTGFKQLVSRIVALDHAAMLGVRKLRSRPLTAVLKGFTYSGTGQAWIVFSLTLNALEVTRVKLLPAQTEFLRASLCALLAWALGSLIKKRVDRFRPAGSMPGYVALITAPACKSFPSSHASSSIAFFVALLLSGHELAPYVGAWAAVVTFSRFYLGVHFPSDLLGGAVLGAACGSLIGPISSLLFGAARP